MNRKKFSIIFALRKLRKIHACPVNTSSCPERSFSLPLSDNLRNSSLFKDILHPVNLTTCEDSSLPSINNASNSSNFNFSSINSSNFSSLNISGSKLSNFLPWTTCATGQLQLVPHELRVRWNIVNTCEIFWKEYFYPISGELLVLEHLCALDEHDSQHCASYYSSCCSQHPGEYCVCRKKKLFASIRIMSKIVQVWSQRHFYISSLDLEYENSALLWLVLKLIIVRK